MLSLPEVLDRASPINWAKFDVLRAAAREPEQTGDSAYVTNESVDDASESSYYDNSMVILRKHRQELDLQTANGPIRLLALPHYVRTAQKRALVGNIEF